MERGIPPSIAVVREVAAREETEPTELQPPLHTVVDTDALDALFLTDGRPRTGSRLAPESDLSVEFTYLEYRVRVGDCGTVRVTDETERDGFSRSAGEN
ncbi:HalOD1 output domain-containing protein [Halobiforma nitratireducens]|uniref:Halobacterial output domain-containing protein n=1 Tax=Halobiforma nitratireducens JCM 10879 TaxID=1227454 RepID=M0M648_9EURY|nr:HalOD1 output domain-containing protein [Halobiforma nitratireducens]EMA41171.1 hypothetical protein C446_06425 [Halobiforma nitratireducens JCM 10879]